MTNDILKALPSLNPCVAKYLESLLLDGRIGICAGTIKIKDVGSSNSSCNIIQEKPCGDRFKLQIPYGGEQLTWEVIFNHNQPKAPPDFIFGTDEKFVPEIENIKSLVNWDADDATSLLRVIQEFLSEYKSYQQSLLQDDMYSRLQFEYNSLLEQGSYDKKDVEIYVTKRSEVLVSQVNFLVKLPIDFSEIPPYLIMDYPGENSAVLSVNFQLPDTSKVKTQLFLSPGVEHALGGMRALKLPSFLNGTCLIDYIPDVCSTLNKRIKQIQENFIKRREYVSAFLSIYGRSIIEHDSEEFSSLSLLLNWRDFSFVVIIELPQHFPQDQPVFTFQSVYHETANGMPYGMTKASYPYSPRWTATEMAHRAGNFWISQISEFQKSSVKEGSL